MNLGQTIHDLRKRQGLRQGDLADMTGLTQAYVSQIEKNRKEPNLSTLRKIGDALALPLPVLFFLSLDESDVPMRKREYFEMIGPSIKSMLKEFFLP